MSTFVMNFLKDDYIEVLKDCGPNFPLALPNARYAVLVKPEKNSHRASTHISAASSPTAVPYNYYWQKLT